MNSSNENVTSGPFQSESDSTAGTILLVEDDLELLDILAQILRSAGYTVLANASSTDAMKELAGRESGDIDLLVSDLVMPDVGGLELAYNFRQNYPDAKILIISGYTDEMVIFDEKLTPNTYFLAKPIRSHAFKAKVAELLAPE